MRHSDGVPFIPPFISPAASPAMLTDNGCTHLQNYIFARPLYFIPTSFLPLLTPPVVCLPSLLFLFGWASCGMSVSQHAVQTAILVLGVRGIVDVGIPVYG